MLEEVKILEQVDKLSLNPTIIQVLSSTLRLQQKNYKNKNMKHYEHKISHLQLLIFKKQKVLWTNITDILDFLRNQKGGEAGERITLIEILYQQV